MSAVYVIIAVVVVFNIILSSIPCSLQHEAASPAAVKDDDDDYADDRGKSLGTNLSGFSFYVVSITIIITTVIIFVDVSTITSTTPEHTYVRLSESIHRWGD